MIISTNNSPSLAEFKILVDRTTLILNCDATKRQAYYLKRNGQALEDDVKRILDIAAKGTNFEGTIEKISGQCFPDIVAGKYYGVEVKSSKDEKWITLGGSVNESTRIENVERIFLIFGKLKEPVEFRSRPYEDCLPDVVVTHYPRYMIDMNLKDSETIFCKMGTTYDDLRSSENLVEKIVDYYKSQLCDGESLWWTGKHEKDGQAEAVPMKIRLWRTLPSDEKSRLVTSGLALFPDILGESQRKYERFSLWLVAKHSVLSTSLRDPFSAGGKDKLVAGNAVFNDIPRKIINVHKNADDICDMIRSTDEDILCETWRTEKISDDRMGQWIDLVEKVCTLKNNPIRIVLNAVFGRQ